MSDDTVTKKGKIPRQAEREPAREEPREQPRGVVAIGRDGKPLFRRRQSNVDIFHIDPKDIPDGWSYEWKRYDILGKPDDNHRMMVAENGWTPVPASRYPGRYRPVGEDGPIRRDECILMERPMVLTEEARQEQRDATRRLIQHQRETVGLETKFSTNAPNARAASYIRTEVVSASEAPRPQHQLAID